MIGGAPHPRSRAASANITASSSRQYTTSGLACRSWRAMCWANAGTARSRARRVGIGRFRSLVTTPSGGSGSSTAGSRSMPMNTSSWPAVRTDAAIFLKRTSKCELAETNAMRMDAASTRSGGACKGPVIRPVDGGPRAPTDAVYHDVGDAVAGLAVPVWAGDFCRRVLIRPEQFLMESLADLARIRAYQPRKTRVHALGPLGHAAGHQHPLLKGRGLLLNSARIRENGGAVREQVHHVEVRQRVHKPQVGEPGEESCNRSTDIGVGMHRQDRPHLRMSSRERRQPGDDALQVRPEALATMQGRHHVGPPGARPGPCMRTRFALAEIGSMLDRVDDGVARDEDCRRADALGAKVRCRSRRSREVKIGDRVGETPHRLLGERRVLVEAPETRFDVTDCSLLEVRGQCREEHRAGVPLDQDEGRCIALERVADRLKAPGADRRQALVFGHDAQGEVRLHGERRKQVARELPVLPREDEAHRDGLGPGAESPNHGSHLDDFGARAVDAPDDVRVHDIASSGATGTPTLNGGCAGAASTYPRCQTEKHNNAHRMPARLWRREKWSSRRRRTTVGSK